MAAVFTLIVVAALTANCRRPKASVVVMDLAASWQQALAVTETGHLAIGSKAARPFLGLGWSHDETSRETGESFTWSQGPSSEIAFQLGWRRQISLEFRCRPFQFPEASVQTIELELNGHAIGPPLELGPSLDIYRVELPADAQIIGRNRLELKYGRTDSPSSVVAGSTDERELAVAWSELSFHGVDQSPIQADTDVLEMPAGSRLEFFVELPPASEMRIEGCEAMGEGPVVVEVSALTESGSTPIATTWACDGKSLVLPFEGIEGLTRLRVSPRPAENSDLPFGVRLQSAQVLASSSPSEALAPLPDPIQHSQGSRPNVIIYLVDALRSDRIGAYGCDRPLTPRLDAMATEGIIFTDVTAQSSWTKASVASIFTGLWPREHGVNGPDDRLPEESPTLPEILQGAGYQTAAVVANAYVGRPFGFARGFDSFEFIEHTRGRSHVLHDRLVAWLHARGSTDDPFFLYIHTIDPHAPYAPPQPFRERFAPDVEDASVGQVETVRGLVLGTVEPTPELGRDLRALYDAEVAANDASFGRLLEELEALGELNDTVVIFTSDHGEAFGEHGSWTHGLDLYNEVLSVPLVMRLPGGAGAGQRVAAPVQHIDFLPTILSHCGVDPPGPLPGSRLVSLAGEPTVGADRTIYAYLDYWGKSGATAMRDGWKLIEPLSAEFSSGMELFRHDDDRGETSELVEVNPIRAGWLAAQLAFALRTEAESQQADVDSETRAQLEALGYMN